MQLIVIHEHDLPDSRCGILHAAASSEPIATVVLNGLIIANSFSGSSATPIIAIPKAWEIESSKSRIQPHYYAGNIVANFSGINDSKDDQWCVITNGRYITKVNHKWLFSILADLNAPVIAVNVDPGLTAFREKLRTTSQGHIAGFRRLYSDIAQEAPLPNDWPQHLFVSSGVLKQLLVNDALPLAFPALLSRCSENSFNLRSISIAGEILDLETQEGFLAFIDNYFNAAGPKSSRNYRRYLDTKDTVIDERVRLFGNVLLGQNVRIHSDAIVIGPAIIGDNVVIASAATVKSSVIASDITVPKGYYLRNRIITHKDQFDRANSCQRTGNGSRPYRIVPGVFGRKHRNDTYRIWPRFSYGGCFKRVFDIIVSLALAILFAPVLPFLMLAVKLSSPGPVFYKDKRQGLHGNEFNCLKFRTMMIGADQIQNKLRVVSQVDGPQFKMEDDPRITTVGEFLRNTYLDEIPQFFNVLLGQMSLIGPRPSPALENSLCPPWRDARLSVRPGLTGLWQICRTRREGQDFQEWIHYDIKYVRELSFKLDLWVFWQTIRMLIRSFIKQF